MANEWALQRHHPLDGLEDALARAGGDGISLEPAPIRSIVNLRGTPDESLVTDVQMALGVELPLMPNRWEGNQRIVSMWLGPDEWLIGAPESEGPGIERAMREARPTDPRLSLVDVSHNYACVRLSGTDARDVLAKGCALDLGAEKFASGACAQTLLAKAPVLLRALMDAGSFELWVRNSYAPYLVAWLCEASVAAQ